MVLFPVFNEPCCSSASGIVLLVIHPANSDEYDFCYEVPEGDFPAIAAGLEKLTVRFDRRQGVWVERQLAVRAVRFCDGCGKNEDIVSFDIPLPETTAVQGDILDFLDGRGLVRRGEVWSVE